MDAPDASSPSTPPPRPRGLADRAPAAAGPPEGQEQPLLPDVAQSAPGAVEACIDRYGGAIWNLSRRLCRNRTDAEDATQDVFVELWRHAQRFDANAGSEWTFVLTIARRRLIDRLRRTGRRRDIAVGEGGGTPINRPQEVDPSAGPLEAATFREDAGEATAALDQLTGDQAKVLRLSIFGEMSYPEISDSLAMPLGTVKTHARRGLIKLRQLLDADGEESADDAG